MLIVFLIRNDQIKECNTTSEKMMVPRHKLSANLQVLVPNMKHDSLSFHLIPNELLGLHHKTEITTDPRGQIVKTYLTKLPKLNTRKYIPRLAEQFGLRILLYSFSGDNLHKSDTLISNFVHYRPTKRWECDSEIRKLLYN
ncbi:unnamed protein product [Vicia faba]|uniref:Uncharacterized protein n=1 Tax=Vicia faba TaxID=3906 RepID=A0AAV1AM13_VICFA|nr:unnamed protein product [Vicia faba]